MKIETLKAGIADYAKEREIIERFLEKPKSQDEFDDEFEKCPTGRFRKEGLPGRAIRPAMVVVLRNMQLVKKSLANKNHDANGNE